ncbi:MAG: hypothetical protein ABI333_08050 [bacterium]
MSKNTKVIAIVGGILILGLVIYMGASKGGFGSAFEAMGCGGKKKAKKPRKALDAKAQAWEDCRKLGYIAKRDKGKIVMQGKRPVPQTADKKKATCECLSLWKAKCGEAGFKGKNKDGCKRKVAEAGKKCGGDEGGGGDSD